MYRNGKIKVVIFPIIIPKNQLQEVTGRTVQSIQRQATGWTAGARFSVRAKNLSLLHSVQTGSGAHAASYPTSTGCSSSRLKRLGREAGHSTPSVAEVKSSGAIHPLPYTSSGRGA
jgi:hypothetical protein